MNTIIVRSEHQSDFESHYINELIIPKVKKINVNTEEFFDLEQKLIKDSKIIIICSPGNQKVKKDINWRPKITIAEGIKDLFYR